jgi:chromate reductase, NAD(P)H dehydrogenase (quinone)
MRVLGISGSLRQGSHNTELLRAAAKLLPPGTQLELYEGLAGIPPYGEDVEHEPPQAVTELKDAIAAADVVLFSTPEYNHSLPGQLKNALDWVSRPYADNPLIGKPVAVLGASSGMFGAVWAQAELRKVVTAMGGRVIHREFPLAGAKEAFAPDGSLADAALEQVAGGPGRSAVRAAGRRLRRIDFIASAQT